MKNNVTKVLGKPKIIIPTVLIVALVLGVFIYKFVGYGPKNELSTTTLDVSVDQIKDGQVVDLAFPKTGRVAAVYVKQGDAVKKGKILANLDYTDVRGALEIAKANYQKLINGATGADIDVAKATVETAQVNFDTVTKQQNLAVESAYRNLLNSTLEVVSDGEVSNYIAPTISGNYILNKEGDVKITVYYTTGGSSFLASGILDNINGGVNSVVPQPIGDSGLYIKFPSINSSNVSNWVIHIPNKKASNYVSNYNAYQSALESQKRLIAIAQANLDQANTILLQRISNARPEDVAAASGALQVAQGAYDNDFIYAPADGTITAVNMGVGEIALANARVISMITKSSQ